MKNKELFKEILFYITLVGLLVFIIISQVYTRKDEIITVAVHIKGEVVNPGYYEVENDSRLNDVLTKAGGPTANADLDAVNLAMFLVDGEEIVIPGKSQNGNKTSQAEELSEAETKKGTDDSKLININTAEMFELCELDGIGESMAQRIIEYRNSNGKFKKIEDLMNVNGIGPAKFNNIKDKITV